MFKYIFIKLLPIPISNHHLRRYKNKCKNEKVKDKDDPFNTKRKVHTIKMVKDNREKMNYQFSELIKKLKIKYWDNERQEYNHIKILEDGVFNSVMEKDNFFRYYKDILFK